MSILIETWFPGYKAVAKLYKNLGLNCWNHPQLNYWLVILLATDPVLCSDQCTAHCPLTSAVTYALTPQGKEVWYSNSGFVKGFTEPDYGLLARKPNFNNYNDRENLNCVMGFFFLLL